MNDELRDALDNFYKQQAEATADVDPAAGLIAWKKPLVSMALGVHESQVDEANARAKRHGLGVVYDKSGRCHIPDRSTRKKLIKLERYHDNNGGYGD